MKHKAEKSVSVIIAARNESINVAGLLEKLSQQTHCDFEVIIANDRSEDDTLDILNSYTKKFGHFHHIDVSELPDGWSGKKNAIYQGIKQAKNEVLLFTDADCIPNSNQWISEISNAFNPDIDIVLGLSPYQYRQGFLNKFIQFETLFTAIQFVGFTKMGKPYMGLGRNMAIRRSKYDLSLLESISDHVGGDDDLMVNALSNSKNTIVITSHQSQTQSLPENSWGDYFKQKIRHLSAGKYYQKKDRTLLGLFTLSFLFGWILFFTLLVSALNPYFILTAFALRSLSFYVIFARLGRKLGSPINLWSVPLLDLCYSIYYPIVGLKALLTKNIQWK
ncbi:glycosyltransferase [Roseivirga sp.]|uniref:glycosyltransferase n=1 Tax=Roseivirga sp. TaxID=1964215 RepID=UPI003B8ACDAB